MKETTSELLHKFRRSIRHILTLPPSTKAAELEKIDESLTPNMRALRLVMTMAEQLLSMGVAARDVVQLALGVTDTYCTRRVHIDISYTLITVSQDRGNDREPLTLVRTIVLDDVNYRVIQAIQSLALTIRDTHLPLDEAERMIDEIVYQPKHNSRWVIYTAGGVVSAGVVLLYNGSPLMIGMSFITGFLATGMLRWMARVGLSTFYSQIAAALCITLVAVIMVRLNALLHLAINPTLFVIGGIVLLVAGMMTVGAFQDAIDEYYVTANARILKVIMATGGIVIGVITGLYIAARFSIRFPATPDQLVLASPHTQYLGALIIAAAFAARNHAAVFGTIVSGGVGMLGWWISRLVLATGLGTTIASGVAAATIGLMATFVSRFWRFPSLAIIGAGIVPLVPGLSLYNGLLGVATRSPGNPEFMAAIAVLLQAFMIALAVASGATLGNMIGRPIRRRVIRFYSSAFPRRHSQ